MTQLKFNITYSDGTSEVQEFRTSATDPGSIDMEVLKAMGSYGTFGVLRKLEKERRWVFVPSNRITKIEVDIPAITIASGADASMLRAKDGQFTQMIPPLLQGEGGHTRL